MHQYRELLTSFLASAMLTTTLFPAAGAAYQAGAVDPGAALRAMNSAFMSSAAAGWQAPMQSVSAAPAAPIIPVAVTALASASKPFISPEKLQAIIDLALGSTRVVPVNAVLTQGLNLPHPFMSKGARIVDGDVTHGLSVNVSDPTKLILYRKASGMMHVYAMNRDTELLAAGTYANGVFTPIALDQAKPGLEAELKLWDAEPLPEQPRLASTQSNS